MSREALAAGLEQVRLGRFWHAHETWEEVWHSRRDADDAGFYKGLIHMVAGLLHLRRRNYRGAGRLLSTARTYLAPYAPAHQGLELAPILDQLQTWLESVARRQSVELTLDNLAALVPWRIQPE